METTTQSKTAAEILHAEARLLKVGIKDNEQITYIMKSDSVEEMKSFADSAKLHLYQPFEMFGNEYYQLYYYSEFNRNICIQVNSKQLFKRVTSIEEI